MFPIRLILPALALLAAQTAQATETWESASGQLQAHVDARRGHGAIVQIERVDARTVRVRLKALWPLLRGASFQGGGDLPFRRRVCQMGGGDTDALVDITAIGPRATHLDVRFQGSDFNPKIRMRLPGPGQTEVGAVLVGGSPDA